MHYDDFLLAVHMATDILVQVLDRQKRFDHLVQNSVDNGPPRGEAHQFCSAQCGCCLQGALDATRSVVVPTTSIVQLVGSSLDDPWAAA